MIRRLSLIQRPRRNRKSAAVRGLVRETDLRAEQLVYPLFVHDRDRDEPIEAMPGCLRRSIESAAAEVRRVAALGIRAVVLFPKIEEEMKDPHGSAADDGDGLVPRAIREIRRAAPDAAIITDVALDPYSSDGHDGVVGPDGRVLNDETVEILCRQAVCHARAGADIVAPSDMMDGRVGAIRAALDGAEFTDVSIMAYTAKYASALYGPFRGALDSAPRSGDKKTYQMDPANAREALREAALDEHEGADILMVKPAVPYLDVICRLREQTSLPIAAYHVSGEFLMIKSAAASGWLDERAAVLEILTSIRRSGADIILTYFAPEAAEWLSDQSN